MVSSCSLSLHTEFGYECNDCLLCMCELIGHILGLSVDSVVDVTGAALFCPNTPLCLTNCSPVYLG